MYDCIVVGAGPAGASTAYHLARQGYSVLILEKAVLPRYKPCSGAVSPGIATYFAFDFTPVIDCERRQVRYTWKLGDPVEATLTTVEPIWLVRRDRFDHFLVQQAQAEGADLKDDVTVIGIEFKGDRWRVSSTIGSFEAAYLVGADGAHGPMASWLGLASVPLRTAQLWDCSTADPLPINSPLGFEFGLVKQGCLWSFPRQQGYSVGAVSFLDQTIADYQVNLRHYIEALNLPYDQGQVYTHALKLWNGHCCLHTHRALLVGEAAAIVDPLSAEGIRPSIVSGVHAANAINAALSGKVEDLGSYTTTMQTEWGNDIQWAKRIAGLFFRVPGIGYRVGIKRPTATQRLGQLLTGEVKYADIANRVMKRMSGGLLSGW